MTWADPEQEANKKEAYRSEMFMLIISLLEAQIERGNDLKEMIEPTTKCALEIMEFLNSQAPRD